jgi:hypothetical protein
MAPAGMRNILIILDLHKRSIQTERRVNANLPCATSLRSRSPARRFRRCSELLLKRLGVQPSSKTLALYQSVRQEAMSP